MTRERMQSDLEEARRYFCRGNGFSLSHPEQGLLCAIVMRWEEAKLLNDVNIYADGAGPRILEAMENVMAKSQMLEVA